MQNYDCKYREKNCVEKDEEYMIALELKSITIQGTRSMENPRGWEFVSSCFHRACILEEKDKIQVKKLVNQI